MALCNVADQFERAEGVKAETMIRSDLFALFLLSNSANGSQKDALGRAMGEKAEYMCSRDALNSRQSLFS